MDLSYHRLTWLLPRKRERFRCGTASPQGLLLPLAGEDAREGGRGEQRALSKRVRSPLRQGSGRSRGEGCRALLAVGIQPSPKQRHAPQDAPCLVTSWLDQNWPVRETEPLKLIIWPQAMRSLVPPDW
jgi:hypothetical protein